MDIDIIIPMNHVTSPEAMHRGTEIAHIKDAESGYEGELSVVDYNEDVFQFSIYDSYDAVLLDESVACKGMSASKMETYMATRMKKFIHECNILDGKEDPYERIPVEEFLHPKTLGDYSAKDLMNPEKQEHVIQLLVQDLVKNGKDLDAIDETFSEIKMSAIIHAEKLERENPQAMKGDGRS